MVAVLAAPCNQTCCGLVECSDNKWYHDQIEIDEVINVAPEFWWVKYYTKTLRCRYRLVELILLAYGRCARSAMQPDVLWAC